MAPELRARKAKPAAISDVKPASKAKSASKRKATEDATPIVTKKSKAIKADGQSKSPKTSRATAPKQVQQEEPSEEDGPEESDDENDQVKALVKAVDSDDEEENDTAHGGAMVQEIKDIGKPPKVSKELAKASKSESSEPGVVYVGRIPHGFYEHGMREYFSQFGDINKIRMSRNKATGRSKHFAFIEFADAAVAEIVAKTMDNYLLAGHILKVKVVPKSQIHENLWKGANKRFKQIPWNKMAGNRLKKPLTESGWTDKIAKEEKKRNERAQKLAAIGYEFDAPQLKAVEDVPKSASALEADDGIEAPKAIEAASEPKQLPAEAEETEPTEASEVAEKPSKVVKQVANKATKKTKKSSKSKKA
ncbi:RNA-binding domain-containing protein [Xylariaceae sp. FL0016]|nr:RNA-binding domain-containing protein [Xylariaceae sp. FL0016]